MKFWLVIIAIVAIAFYCARGCSKAKDDFGKLKNGGDIFGGFSHGPATQVQSSNRSPMPAATSSQGQSAALIFQGPHEETGLVFANRTLPADAWFKEWTLAGLHVVTDPVARRVYASGPAMVLSAFKHACEGADQVPGDCGLKVWMLYVSDQQQKGWDLTAAIGAITGNQTTIQASAGSFILNVNAGKIATAIDIIADGTIAQVVQSPYVQLQDGQAAVVESTQDYPVASSVLSNGVTQTSVSFKKIGLTLNVTPQFLERDRVCLHVEQGNGVISSTVNIGNNQVPVVDTQKVSSVVTLDMDQSVVLGGIKSSKITRSKGIFHDTATVETGSLYVILSVSSDIPKALPAIIDYPSVFPLGSDGMVLPPKNKLIPSPK